MACPKYFLAKNKFTIDPGKLNSVIKTALAEDIGKADITTGLIIPKNKKIKAAIIAKEDFLLCGIAIAGKVFKTVDPALKFEKKAIDGAPVKNKKIIATIEGKASSILTAERVALNLVSLLSGIATKTNEFVKKIVPFKTKITDTRKTLPGLRELQKYAVRTGGGYSHRMSLDEMVLIKDNHLKAARGFLRLLNVPKGLKVEIESQSLKEFKNALRLDPDVIMLDNIKIKDIREAVKMRDAKFKSRGKLIKLEASGGIRLGNIKKYAATGVDLISVGELTDTVKSVDISLEII